MRSIPRFLTAALALFAVCILGLHGTVQATSPSAYTITDIGALSPGQSSNATALNARGDVVGQVETTDPPYGFIFRRGHMERLVPPHGFAYCLPVGINDSDVIIATATREDGTSAGFALHPAGTSFAWIPLPLESNKQRSAMPVAIDSAGDIAGNIWLDDSSGLSPMRSVVWKPIGRGAYRPPTLLSLSRGFTGSVTGAISIVGKRVVVAGAEGNGVEQDASVWAPSGHLTRILGTLPYVTGIGVRGGTVMATGIAWGRSGSIAWSEKIDPHSGSPAASSVSFLNPPHGYDYSEASGVEVGPRGMATIVGDVQARAQFLPQAAVWSRGGVRLLHTLLPAGSPWTLSDAAAINARGQIVGFGSVGRQDHAYVLTPG